MLEFLKQPWPWYVAGPLIGLTVPALLLLGNESLGIRSSLLPVIPRSIPAKTPFLPYCWQKQYLNVLLVPC